MVCYARLVLLVSLAGLLTSVRPGGAQSTGCGSSATLEPVAFEKLTISTTVTGLTASLFQSVSATVAFVSVEAQPLRYTTFGTPTATDGHLVEPPAAGNADAGKGAWFCGLKVLNAVRFVRTGGTDSTVQVSYYRYP